MNKFLTLILGMLSFTFLSADVQNNDGDYRYFVSGYATGLSIDYDRLHGEAHVSAMEQFRAYEHMFEIDDIYYSVIPNPLDPTLITVECRIYMVIPNTSDITSMKVDIVMGTIIRDDISPSSRFPRLVIDDPIGDSDPTPPSDPTDGSTPDHQSDPASTQNRPVIF